MLQFIRTHAQGWVAFLLVGIIALAFTLWGLESVFTFQSEEVVAKIDKNKITAREFERAYERLSRFRRPTSQEEVEQLKKVTLDRLVNMAVLDNTTKDLGLYVSDEQVRRTIMSSPDFHVDGVFSKARYLDALKGALLTDNDVQDEIRHMMIVEQLQKGIIDSAFVVEEDLSELIAYIEQQRSFGYFEIPQSRFEDEVVISEEKAREYYDSHQQFFKLPAQAKVEYVELSLTPIAASLSLSDEEIRQFYLEHPGLFSKDERIRAAHILVAMSPNPTDEDEKKAQETLKVIYDGLAMGDSFEDLAKRYSDDPISARDGGDLDWFGKGQMIESFEKAAFALAKNEVSEPVRSDYGYHIIKVLDHHAPERIPFDEIKDEVEAKLRNVRSEDILYESLENASTLAYEYPNTLDNLAATLGLDVEESDFFSQEGGRGIFTHPRILAAVFGPEVFNEGLNSELIQIHPEAYIVLRLKETKPESLQSFEEVKSEIVGALTSKEAKELTEGLGKDLQAELLQNKTPQDLAQERNLTWETLESLTRTDQSLDPALVNLVFSIPRSIDGKPSVATQRLNNGSFVVVKLDEIVNGNIADIDEERIEVLQKGVEVSFGQTDYQLLLTDGIKDKKIDINL